MNHTTDIQKNIPDWDAFHQDPDDENICYYGFCDKGTTSLAEKKWCILRELKTQSDGKDILIKQWSNGNKEYTEDFKNLSDKNYQFLKK